MLGEGRFGGKLSSYPDLSRPNLIFSYTDPGAKLSERNVQFGPRHNKE